MRIVIVSIENVSKSSSFDRDYVITDSKVSESDSGTSDGEPGQTLESSNWHDVTHLDREPSKAILIQRIEFETSLPSNFD
jgi:hypothetical protein